ncbi:MAG TPA: tetratricopeptide repeat protein, partial [Rhodocyclaceae bacterium]|nr:tetratricopeptide repeat protein [Rhodocyclaceae bacterium]
MSAMPGDTSASLIEEAFNSAVTHYRNGQFEMAEQLFRAILELEPNHANANYNLGLLAAHFKRMPEALGFLNKALMAAPHETSFWLSYLEALASIGDIDTARQTLALSRQHGLALQGPVVTQIDASPNAPTVASVPVAATMPQSAVAHPSDIELRTVNIAFQRKNFALLEVLGRDITQRYP